MKKENIFKLVIAIVVSEGIGLIGGLATSAGVSGWYLTLAKPALNPPNWIFGPVWTLLYILMGVAAFFIWQRGLGDRKVRKSLIVYGVQLLLNLLWSIVFFGLHSPLWALVVIIFLWLFILLTIVEFYKQRPLAAYLLIPYILCVSFASYLNYMLWFLN